MTLEEKAGLFFHTMIAIGDLDEPNPIFGTPSAREFVDGKQMTHFNLLGAAPSGREIAALAQRAAAARGIHSSRHPGDALDRPASLVQRQPGRGDHGRARSRSGPRPMGLAAIGDEELVERFADIARQEYTAVGLRVALHPQVDLATEPRWARQLRRSARTPSCPGASAPRTSADSRARRSARARSRR